MRVAKALAWFLNATALWAFLTLVSTGLLHLPAVVVALPLMVLPMFKAARQKSPPPVAWTFLTLLAFLAAILNAIVVSDILYSLVYLFLFLEIAKLWTLRQNRDVLQVLVLSFFQMVAASVATDSVGFAFLFFGYMFFLTVTWMLFSIQRESETYLRRGWLEGRWRKHDATPPPVPIPNTGGAPDAERPQTPVLKWNFFQGSAWLTLVLAVLTAAIFIVIPRLSAQRFLSGLQMMRSQRVSGMSDRIDFTTAGPIQLDPTIIGRVQVFTSPDDPLSPPDSLRLRATSLDTYDGSRWGKSREVLQRHVWYSTVNLTVPDLAPEGRVLRQDIFLEPDGSNYFFAASSPLRFGFARNLSLHFDSINYSLMSARGREASIRYSAVSIIAPEPFEPRPADSGATERTSAPAMASSPAPDKQEVARAIRLGFETIARSLGEAGRIPYFPRTPPAANRSSAPPADSASSSSDRSASTPRSDSSQSARDGNPARTARRDPASRSSRRLPGEMRRIFTRVPDIDDMEVVRQLAREWTADPHDDNLARARRIEHRLRTRYEYATEIAVAQPNMHITNFLTRTRRGHCEYFASAMTLMLRTLEIPTRLVTGYYTDDFNETGKYFLVRRQHAHSWVEVWDDRHGWVTFDPTPPAGLGSQRIGIPGFLTGIQKYLDTLRFYWYRHVIDYDLQDQYRLAAAASSWQLQTSDRLNRLLRPLRQGQRALLLRARGMNPVSTLLLALCFGAAVGLAWLFARELTSLFGSRRHPSLRTAPPGVLRQIRYYLEILDTLAALRYRRHPGQTPGEFARAVVAQRGDWAEFLPVTRAYYEARFRSGTVPERELERARALVTRIRREGRKRQT